MSDIAGHQIREIINGGCADNGMKIHFDLRFEDGNTTTFLCQHQRLGNIIISLHGLMKMAADERGGGHASGEEASPIEESIPLQPTYIGVGKSVSPADLSVKAIAIRIRTQQSIVIDFALSPDEARGLIESLRQELDEN